MAEQQPIDRTEIDQTPHCYRFALRPVSRYAGPHEREDAGNRINPKTATVFWDYGQLLDPYGDGPELPPGYDQVGRVYFAVDPDERLAVCFYDLPRKVREALHAKHDAADQAG